MSLREHRNAASTHPSSSLDVNVGAFVDHYQKLTELLYPLRIAGTAIVYVIRWENYFLTLAVLVFLSLLLYFPALFLSFLIVACISLMGVGWYFGQSHSKSLVKRAKSPHPHLIDGDQQEMKKHHKEQKNAHKALSESLLILRKADSYVVSLTNSVEYLTRIVTWKSFEVSLCVTVLLCVVLFLLCTVYLRVIASCLPLLILCSNKYFLRRTIELWKRGGRAVIRLTRREHIPLVAEVVQEDSQLQPTVVEGESVCAPSSSMEVVHHQETSVGEGPDEDHPTTEVNNTAVASSNLNTDSDDNGRSGANPRSRAAALDGSITESTRDSPKPQLMSKGYCYKCNVSFAKLLKRKHDCNNCGQSFCGSCTVKVKKCLLGATSPAAYEESVRVCLDCELQLRTNK